MRDLNVDQIKKLWVLDLIIQSGSLKKAALQAKVSPSAISQTLASLEKSVGRPLLIRERGVVTPTSDADAILDVVRPAFAAFEQLKNLNQVAAPKMSWLNLGTYESLAVDLLPGLVSSLRRQLPHLKLSLRVSRTSQLLTMVRKGELCSALITEVDDLDKFYVREVTKDRLGLFVSRRHPIAEKGWRALAEDGWGTLSPSTAGLPRYFQKFLRQLDGKPFVSCDSFETLRATASAGSLVAVLPVRVARRNEDLIEIQIPKERVIKGAGEHRILVVSQVSCDREETDFVADQARRLLKIED